MFPGLKPLPRFWVVCGPLYLEVLLFQCMVPWYLLFLGFFSGFPSIFCCRNCPKHQVRKFHDEQICEKPQQNDFAVGWNSLPFNKIHLDKASVRYFFIFQAGLDLKVGIEFQAFCFFTKLGLEINRITPCTREKSQPHWSAWVTMGPCFSYLEHQLDH